MAMARMAETATIPTSATSTEREDEYCYFSLVYFVRFLSECALYDTVSVT